MGHRLINDLLLDSDFQIKERVEKMRGIVIRKYKSPRVKRESYADADWAAKATSEH